MQHYLTKWELYVLFVEYLRFQQISFSPAVYCFKARRQLATLREQPFFQTNPNIAEDEFKQILRGKNAEEIILKRSHNKHFNVYFHNRKIFIQWLNCLLFAYQADELHSRREQFCSHERSMRHTLDLLKQYAKINSKKILLKDTLNDMAGNTIQTSERVRLYEDILVLVQKECLSVDDVILNNTKILIDTECKDDSPSFSLRLTFLKPIEEIESFLRSTPVYVNLPAEEQPKAENVDTQKILEKLNALEVKADFQSDDGEDGPNSYLGLRIEDEEIYYKDKPEPLKFRPKSKEMKLVSFLIKRQGRPASQKKLIKTVGLTSRSNKKGNDIYGNEEKRGPKPKSDKRIADKLRHIISVVSKKLSDVNLTIIKTDEGCIILKKVEK